MLVLSRKVGESIHIGNDVQIVITAVKGGRIQIAIEAPREVSIRRGELVAKPAPLAAYTESAPLSAIA